MKTKLPDELVEQIDYAIHLKNKGHLQKSVEILTEANHHSPSTPVVVGLLGVMLHQAGFLTEALPILKESIVLSPSSETSSRALFHTLWEMKEREKAIGEIKRFYMVSGRIPDDYREIIDEINAVDKL